MLTDEAAWRKRTGRRWFHCRIVADDGVRVVVDQRNGARRLQIEDAADLVVGGDQGDIPGRNGGGRDGGEPGRSRATLAKEKDRRQGKWQPCSPAVMLLPAVSVIAF